MRNSLIPGTLVRTALFCLAAGQAHAQTLFFDDFNGPTLNATYQATLPTAPHRFGMGPDNYIGASQYSFQDLGGASVIRLHNILGYAQRVGWSTSQQFLSNSAIWLEARVNTLTQSPTTGIDALFELWILDPTNLPAYDKLALTAPDYGYSRVFTAGSSITNMGIDTPFPFTDNTWYRFVITGSPTQEVRLSIYADDGTTELIGVSVGHTLSAYGSGFVIGLSQSMGAPGAPYPTDGAIDWIKLSGPCQVPAAEQFQTSTNGIANLVPGMLASGWDNTVPGSTGYAFVEQLLGGNFTGMTCPQGQCLKEANAPSPPPSDTCPVQGQLGVTGSNFIIDSSNSFYDETLYPISQIFANQSLLAPRTNCSNVAYQQMMMFCPAINDYFPYGPANQIQVTIYNDGNGAGHVAFSRAGVSASKRCSASTGC